MTIEHVSRENENGIKEYMERMKSQLDFIDV